jgi:hypothetical protein
MNISSNTYKTNNSKISALHTNLKFSSGNEKGRKVGAKREKLRERERDVAWHVCCRQTWGGGGSRVGCVDRKDGGVSTAHVGRRPPMKRGGAGRRRAGDASAPGASGDGHLRYWGRLVGRRLLRLRFRVWGGTPASAGLDLAGLLQHLVGNVYLWRFYRGWQQGCGGGWSNTSTKDTKRVVSEQNTHI